MVNIFSVEGNIGSGKSTLVEHMKSFYGDKFLFIQEPVDEWEMITDKQGINMLQKYYKEPKKYAFSFQMMAFISRMAKLRKAINEGYKVIITERSVYTDKIIFANMLQNLNLIEDVEYIIYCLWFDEFTNDIPHTHHIYIRTEPETAHQRMLSRKRKGEVVSLNYLNTCHDYHENWLLTKAVLILDGNTNISDNKNHLSELSNMILDTISKHSYPSRTVSPLSTDSEHSSIFLVDYMDGSNNTFTKTNSKPNIFFNYHHNKQYNDHYSDCNDHYSDYYNEHDNGYENTNDHYNKDFEPDLNNNDNEKNNSKHINNSETSYLGYNVSSTLNMLTKIVENQYDTNDKIRADYSITLSRNQYTKIGVTLVAGTLLGVVSSWIFIKNK